jgi:outer membrane protein assembly factor BamB
MTCTIRCGVLAIAAWLVLFVPADARAQPEQRPSTILPMELRWTKVLSAAPAAAPVHEDGRVFVARRDGQIAAVSLLDGEQVWEVARTVAGQPAVGGGLLYVETRGELHGLDTATGEARWSIPLEAPLSAPLVWNSGWLIVALDTQTLLALRAETGETIWQRTVAGGIDVAPALAGDRMYVSLDSGSVLAVSLMTGATAWDRQLEGAPSQVLPLDALFVGATDNHFYRLSRLDGSIEWRWRTGGDVVGLPAVDEKRVYFSSLDNVLWALDRASGVQQWRQALDTRPTAGPVHIGDLLAIGGLSRFLTLFDPVGGVAYGRLAAPTELAVPALSVMTPSDGPFLVVVTGDGRLQAFGRASTPALLDPTGHRTRARPEDDRCVAVAVARRAGRGRRGVRDSGGGAGESGQRDRDGGAPGRTGLPRVCGQPARRRHPGLVSRTCRRLSQPARG